MISKEDLMTIKNLAYADWDYVRMIYGEDPEEIVYYGVEFKDSRFTGGNIEERVKDKKHFNITKYDSVEKFNKAFYNTFAERFFKDEEYASMNDAFRVSDWDKIILAWAAPSGIFTQLVFDLREESSTLIFNKNKYNVAPSKAFNIIENNLEDKDLIAFYKEIARFVGYTGKALSNVTLKKIAAFRDEKIKDVIDDLLVTSEYWNMGAAYDLGGYDSSYEAIKFHAFTIWDEDDDEKKEVYSPNLKDLEPALQKAVKEGYADNVENLLLGNEDWIDASVLIQYWFFGDVIYG